MLHAMLYPSCKVVFVICPAIPPKKTEFTLAVETMVELSTEVFEILESFATATIPP